MTAYSEMHAAALEMLRLVKRYETAITVGDSSTRSSTPAGDGSHATGRLVEVTTLSAARAYINAGGDPTLGTGDRDERDANIDHAARRLAARPEFRAAINAAVNMVLTRQR